MRDTSTYSRHLSAISTYQAYVSKIKQFIDISAGCVEDFDISRGQFWMKWWEVLPASGCLLRGPNPHPAIEGDRANSGRNPLILKIL
jgi:hypothetical protein